jgi:DNA-binding transcriptional MerR regulator
MLRIGEFSRLSQVTVKALHHYDELGLIKPAHIDPITNYRFYDVKQLPRIHRIMALKEMGLSLEQIGLMLDEKMPTEHIRGMLRLKQAEIEQEMREAHRQLSLVEFRLRMIEAETNFPDLDVVLKSLEPMRALSFFVRTKDAHNDGPHSMLNVVEVIKQAITDEKIQHTGIVIDVFHGETILPFESLEIGDDQHEILIAVEKSQEPITLEGIGPFVIRDEPAVKTAATLMLTGQDGGRLNEVEKATLLRRWAIAHGYKPHDHLRYLHHRGPLQTSTREEFIVEAQLPVDTED